MADTRSRPAPGALAEGAAVTLVALIALAVFYRFQIAGGFRLAFGDRYDAMIEIAILQHWANVLAGLEPWNRTAYFYPAADTLGYNDGYFLYGLIYAAGRARGLAPVASAELLHALFKLAGTIGMYALLRRLGRCRMGWSLFGAALFATADIGLQHANHGQLFTVAMVPWALLLGTATLRAIRAGDARAIVGWGGALALFYAAWISTAYYLAYLFALFIGIATIVALLRATGPERTAVIRTLRSVWAPLLAVALLFLLLMTPFLLVYLPKARETGMHNYENVRGTGLMPLDYLNMVRGNLMWGRGLDLLRTTIAPKLKSSHDQIFGLAPVLLAMTILAAIRQRRAPGASRWSAATGIALFVAWALMLKMWRFSPWWLVYHLVPGAAGIRVIGRWQLVLLVPAILLVTMMLDRARRRGWALSIAALLVAEEISTTAPVELDGREQAAMLAGVPPLPPSCTSFSVLASRRGGYIPTNPEYDGKYAHNVDAMMLSEMIARPTVNGFSTFNPPGWNFADPARGDYLARVRGYAAANHISGLCVLNVRATPAWIPLGA